MDVGTTLRTARERRGLGIAEIAARTKITAALLTAIEENAFDRVPRGIFVRGYLRAYAREVGLQPDAVIEQFLAESGEMLSPPPAAAAVAEVSRPDAEMEDASIVPDLAESGPGWGYVLVVAALLVAIVSFNREGATDEPTQAAPVPPQTPAVETARPAPLSEPKPIGTAGQGVRFELRAQGPCWVEAVVDGRRTVYRLMQPGEQEALDGEREIVLRVGDPGAVTYSLNGRTGEPLGRAGIPVTFRFTSEGGQALAS